jgi:ADP-ribose pyrophosphatase YjhB (NUDIX family)
MQNIEFIARGVCIKERHVLLCRGKKAKHMYLPGGHIEYRETAKYALAREIREELGIVAEVGQFLGCCEHTFMQHEAWHAEINLIFEVTLPAVKNLEPLAAQEDWITFLWWPIEKLHDVPFEPVGLRDTIKQWVATKGAKFVTSGDGWQDGVF